MLFVTVTNKLYFWWISFFFFFYCHCIQFSHEFQRC